MTPFYKTLKITKKIKAIKLKTPLSNITIKSKTGAYADDVGAAVLNEEESINSIFQVYNRFSSYFGIRLNETKTEILCLKTNNNFSPQTIKINTGQNTFEVTTVKKINICGITFSCNKR